jgi:hypothetical protein
MTSSLSVVVEVDFSGKVISNVRNLRSKLLLVNDPSAVIYDL